MSWIVTQARLVLQAVALLSQMPDTMGIREVMLRGSSELCTYQAKDDGEGMLFVVFVGMVLDLGH